MSASSLMLGLDKSGAASPFVDKKFDDCRRHCRMIDQSNNQCAGADVHLLDAFGNRPTHLTIRIGVDGESDAEGA